MIKKNIGAYEAKTRFSEILRRVSAGEAFTITNRGKPVADLLPSESRIRQKRAEAINNILQMDKPKPVSDALLKEYKEKGRA